MLNVGRYKGHMIKSLITRMSTSKNLVNKTNCTTFEKKKIIQTKIVGLATRRIFQTPVFHFPYAHAFFPRCLPMQQKQMA